MLRRWMQASCLALALLPACDAPPSEVAPVEVDPGPPTLRRLTAVQYTNIVRDLIGEGVVISQLEPDLPIDGSLSMGSALTTISARGVEQYEAAALFVADQALADPERRARVVPCAPEESCVPEFVATMGRRLWRRPLTGEEQARIEAIVAQATAAYDTPEIGLLYGLAALLQAPSFLFREELGEDDPDAPGERRYSDWEMASRLSFLLWNSTPDDALLDAAERGELTTDQGLSAEVLRMLADPRARAGVRTFFDELYGLYKLEHLSKDPATYPAMSPELGPAAREETLSTIEHLVFDLDGDFRDLMTTRTTFLDRKLASLYAVQAPAREGFAEALLPDDGPRRGLLGQASVLALYSHPLSTSPTLRGKFIREKLLCHEIPAPPAGVDTSIPEPSGTAPTLRDRVAEHLEDPTCATCHLITDPIGLALESFDGIGKWRTEDNGVTIDPSGDLDGQPFADAWALADVLHDHADLGPCLTSQLVRHALGREEADGELEGVDALATAFASHGHRVRWLLYALVTHPTFRRVGPIVESPEDPS